MDTQQHNVILDSISEGVFTVDLDWHITFFNRAAEVITGIGRDQALGKPCREVLCAEVCETGCTLAQTMDTGKPIINRAVRIVDAEGRPRSIAISTALLKDAGGNVIGGVETFRDISMVQELQKEFDRSLVLPGYHQSQSCHAEPFFHFAHDCREQYVGPDDRGRRVGAYRQGIICPARSIISAPVVTVRLSRSIVVRYPIRCWNPNCSATRPVPFTDAKTDKPGRFALAAGGTIFLDEIGDVSAAMQVRLLRGPCRKRSTSPVGAVQTRTRRCSCHYRHE